MFKERVMSSIVLVVLLVLVFWLGPVATGIAFCLVSLKGLHELLHVYGLEKSGFGILGYAMTGVYYLALMLGYEKYTFMLVILYLLATLAVYVFSFPKYQDRDMMAAFLSFVYVSVMLSYVYLLRALQPAGWIFVYLIFVSSWINDVFAYLTGVTIGKHKLTPKLSPKKSVEGFVGGIAGAGIVGAIFGAVYPVLVAPMPHSVWIFALVGAAGAFPAVVGDLTASAIKRNHDVKDYGHLIPGHGGILDRFDSVIFTAPIIYYMLILVGQV